MDVWTNWAWAVEEEKKKEKNGLMKIHWANY